jgi:hypothetical protein
LVGDEIAPEKASDAPGSGTDLPAEAVTDEDADWPSPRQRLLAGRRRREDVPGLVLIWSLWLLGSWLMIRYLEGMSPADLLALGGASGPGVTATSLRWLGLVAVAGLTLAWPAVRLSQGGRRARPLEALGQPLVDWVALMVVWQVVLWPIRPLVGWSVSQTLWLDALMVGWGLLIGAVIGLGRWHGGSFARTAATAACALLLLLEPAAQTGLMTALGEASSWQPRVSPIEAVWGLAAPPEHLSLSPWREQVVGLTAAALAGWVVLGIAIWRRWGAR